jgi:N-acetylmuramoyl-L-alanine amidase
MKLATVLATVLLSVSTAVGTIPLMVDGEVVPNDVLVLVRSGVRYADAEGLAELFGGRVVYNPQKRKLVMSLPSGDAVLTLGSPYVVMGSSTANVFHPVVFAQDRYVVPLESISRVLDGLSGREVSYDSHTGGLLVGKSGRARVRDDVFDCRVVEKENGTIIELLVSRRVPFDLLYGGGRWIDISLVGATVDTAAVRSGAIAGPVSDVRFRQQSGAFSISFKLDRDLQRHSAEFVPGDPARIRISLPIEVEIHRTELQVVVVDPGHGGKDPGAVGPEGVREKDVVLDIARKVARILRDELGLTVVMTRDDDTFIPLARRTEIANQAGADLFVSIHANANRRRSAKGTQTFFLAEARNDEERAVAALENSALRYELPEDVNPDNALDFILLDIAQSGAHHLSSKLAETVQVELAASLEINDRGLGQAGFYVLRGAFMPAILVETAFISNPAEEELLDTDSFRMKAARSIVEGIKRFKNLYDATQ